MARKISPKAPEISFGSRSKLLKPLGISPAHFKNAIFPMLTRGIHYIEMPGGKKFLYNLPLCIDFVLNGNSDAHKRACDAFVRSLASSQAA
jgi:hypothetical protein